MNMFEKIKTTDSNDRAEQRRRQAEEKGELTLSHWRGEGHAHTKTDLTKPATPEDIIEHRKGSNCGTIPLEILTRYHAEQLLNDYIVITEHSRDASPAKAEAGITQWFQTMYLHNENWLKENYGKARSELTSEELAIINQLANTQAKEVALYGDERLEKILDNITNLDLNNKSFKVFKGVEANLLPDGSFDTPLIDQGKFEAVNVSIHPNLDPEAFQPIVEDPKKYSQLMIKGISHPRANIAAHIGEGLKPEVFQQLDWSALAQAAKENKVALEINLKKVMDFIQFELYDYSKYPTNDTSYITELENHLSEFIPILSSSEIRQTLKNQIESGLKLAINTDEHKNRFIETNIQKNGTEFNFKERGIRFWRCLKVLEKYFNNAFTEMGVKKEDIINTYNADELEKFLRKTD